MNYTLEYIRHEDGSTTAILKWPDRTAVWIKDGKVVDSNDTLYDDQINDIIDFVKDNNGNS